MKNDIRWIYLVHLGYNMWLEPECDRRGVHGIPQQLHPSLYSKASYTLRFDDDYWRSLSQQLRDAGCNTILIDIGEGIRYESHPELAVEGSWSREKLEKELERLRGMGFELLPKLNFSACHDEWLGEYSRMLSTGTYYRVTHDLISEVSELFGRPALFHLGMDEETAGHQKDYNYAVIRRRDQWWYDFGKLTSAVAESGSRPWIWSDFGWSHEDEFFDKMSRDVVQSNWYYGDFGKNDYDKTPYIRHYEKLDRAGFDQIPTGSSWALEDNYSRTVKFGNGNLGREHLCGYMQTVWRPTLNETKHYHDAAVRDMKLGIESYKK